MTNRLETSYRRLLVAYPSEFRAEHGEELLGVLLSAAPDSQTRPGVRDTVDLLWNGLVLRGRHLIRALPTTLLERVGLLSLAGGTALSGICLWFGELGPRDGWDIPSTLPFGLYSTGAFLYALWLVVGGLLVTGVVRNARRAAAVLTSATVLLALSSTLVPPAMATQPPKFLVALFAGIACMSCAAPRRVELPRRLMFGGTAMAWTIALGMVMPYIGAFGFYRGALYAFAHQSALGIVVALCLTGVIASVRRPGWALATSIASVPWVGFALLFLFNNDPYPPAAGAFLGAVMIVALLVGDAVRATTVRPA